MTVRDEKRLVRAELRDSATRVEEALKEAKTIAVNRLGSIKAPTPMLKPLEPLLNGWATIQVAQMILMENRSLRRLERLNKKG